jgi:CDP-paratose 2-epimerase
MNDDHPRVVNVGGGRESAISLCQLTEWCRKRLGDHAVASQPETRPFDLPWVVLERKSRKSGLGLETVADDSRHP